MCANVHYSFVVDCCFQKLLTFFYFHFILIESAFIRVYQLNDNQRVVSFLFSYMHTSLSIKYYNFPFKKQILMHINLPLNKIIHSTHSYMPTSPSSPLVTEIFLFSKMRREREIFSILIYIYKSLRATVAVDI